MTNHYYSEKPTAESARRQWQTELRGKTLQLTADAGVFSKNEVDFGTRLLLETFQFPKDCHNVLDVGCGYGVIALTLAKERKDCHFYLIDVNERALELAELNARNNELANISIQKSHLLAALEGLHFSVIISNPPIRAGKKVVHQLFEEASRQLSEFGELWIVIQKKQGAPSALERLKSLFKEVDVMKKAKGYYIIRAKRS